ncbi:MAG: NusG domain II-containing protein [Desulfomonilaceae bacterium]
MKPGLWFRYFTNGDILVILMMFLLAGSLFIFLPNRLAAGGNTVYVTVDGKLTGRYSLSHDRLVSVNGPLGETKVQIQAGKVRILNSPCPNHYCVRMGAVSAGGSALVCVPNRIIVRIGRDGFGGLDAISR